MLEVIKNGNKNMVIDESFLSTYRKKMNTEGLRLSILNHLHYTRAKEDFLATEYDKYLSLSWAVRDRIVERWNKTQQSYYTKDSKRAYYLSLEFLLGRLILNNIVNLNLYDNVKYVIRNFEFDFQRIIEIETDAGLGNGGLGRLAACYLDSLATLGYPAYGYGIRYEYGIFNQLIKDGNQIEEPETWLQHGYPWEIERPEYSQPVKFFGELERYTDENGKEKYKWINTREVRAIPYDIPIIGYRNNTVNTLRLWAARSSKQFDLKIFNHGDYIRAVEDKNYSENISRVLYPNDNIYEGKELRLKQQYFFVSATLQDIIRRFTKSYDDFNKLPDKVAIQLNDTHPTLAIPELMRILVDENKIPWKKAWEITSKTFSYTNHTVLPEALEKWPLNLMQKLLPRHMQLIFDINNNFLNKIRIEIPNSDSMVRNVSIIEEGGEKFVKMANLAIIGSHQVNGVAGLHSEIVKKDIFPEFDTIYPGKFINITNGITQRRWLLLANPKLAELITEKIGDKWTVDLYELKKLLEFENDKEFLNQLYEIKKHNKERLAKYILEKNNLKIDVNSIFDSQTKRMHEYKRQLLNVLHILYLYNKLKDNPDLDIHPITFIFSGKSAPGYFIAKLIIKLINNAAELINNDKKIKDKLKIVFLANYNVSLAQRIIPAVDLSEQISTAGKEASGTGNMKYALNGALTVGTLDGANIEIKQEVGDENIYIFGLKAEEIVELRKSGVYHPRDYNKNVDLKRVLDMFVSGELANGDTGLFRPLYDSLLYGLDGNTPDQYFLLADFDEYVKTQNIINNDYKDKYKWLKMALHNIANMGFFSSDRAIKEYAEKIWNIKPVQIDYEE